MENNIKDVKQIKMVDTCLISNRKSSQILKYCNDNGIVTVGNFLDFYYQNGVKGNSNRKLEITGLVDLLNYKYFDIVNEEFLSILNSEFLKNDLWRGFDKVRLRSDLNLLRRLGLTIEEIKSFYYFSIGYKNLKIIKLIMEFIKPTSHHIYLGAYLDDLFLQKIRLICNYYNLKYNVESNKTMKELNLLFEHKEELLKLKSSFISERVILDDKIYNLEHEVVLIDNMISEKKKILQKS